MHEWQYLHKNIDIGMKMPPPGGFLAFSGHTRKTPGKYQENTRRSVFDLVGAQTDVKPRSFLVFSWAKVAAGWNAIPAFHQANAWKMPGRCLECTWNLRRIPAFHQESTRNVPGGCLGFSRHFPGVFHGDAFGHFHLVFSRHLPGGRVSFRREVGFGHGCLVLSW